MHMLIGAHTSIAGGVHNAILRGYEIGATTVQIFTSNQRQWKSKPISPEEIKLWEDALSATGLTKIMSHDSYLINLGALDETVYEKSMQAFKEEIKRCHDLNISFLNFHPGAATKATEDECLDHIVKSLNALEHLTAKGQTRLLLETTAGQGTNVGYEFEHLAYIIENVHKKIPIGVCIDTCHIFAAGYDIRTEEGWEITLQEFDEVVGLKHLYALHLNDSLQPLNSRKDRHAHIGEGKIGLTAFETTMTHPKLRNLPKYLETPDPHKWKEEINLLKSFSK